MSTPRLNRLIPLLECPTSRRSLKLALDGALEPEGTSVGSEKVRWQVLDGVPNFIRARAAVAHEEIHQHHEGNSLALFDYNLTKFHDTKEWEIAINLSAGNTINKPDNVVEVDVVRSSFTDVLCDTNERLPFRDNCFDVAVSLNAFEHYKYPQFVADEIYRILKPGGRILIQTAFIAPLHLEPYHYFNATKHGVDHWFRRFSDRNIGIPWNYNPLLSVSWIAADIMWHARNLFPDNALRKLESLTMGDLYKYWTEPTSRDPDIWDAFLSLPDYAKERTGVGFEVTARKPGPWTL